MPFAPLGLRLGADSALVGQVSPKLYGDCVDLRDKQIIVTPYVARDLTDDKRDDLTTAGAMVIADFADDCRLDERFIDVDDRHEALRTAGTWFSSSAGF